jgi:hypothetical protein
MIAKKTVLLLIGILGLATSALADGRDDCWRVTTYATMLGRAQACGQDITDSSSRVGKWMDTTFFGSERDAQGQIFTNTIQYSAEKQKMGQSPYSCSSVVKSYMETKWP